MLAPWKKSYDQPRQHIKKQRHHFANKGLCSQSHGFSIVMYECESWTVKKAEHQGTDAFELWCYTLESPSDSKDLAAAAADSKEIKPVNPKRNQP